MEALVTAAKNGDKEAFVQLIRINKQSMYKAAWVYLRNEQDIADALQNTIPVSYTHLQYGKYSDRRSWRGCSHNNFYEQRT